MLAVQGHTEAQPVVLGTRLSIWQVAVRGPTMWIFPGQIHPMIHGTLVFFKEVIAAESEVKSSGEYIFLCKYSTK